MARNIDESFGEAVAALRAEDIAVIGANALHLDGRAAMMAGSSLGGEPGKALGGLMAQGCRVIIACGLEKLVPVTIDDSVRHCGMKGVVWSMGMPVGLIPLVGQVITERDALELLASVRCTVIGRGGIAGAEGSTTMVVEGEPSEVEKAVREVLSAKGARTSGSPGSLTQECRAGSDDCRKHEGCAWKRAGKKGILEWR